MNELTVKESRVRARLEKIIKSGQRTFVRVGLALAQMKKERLYKSTHDNFDAYCQEVFGFGRNYAYMLIDSAEAVQALPKNAHNCVQSECAARELVKVPQDERAQVVESVIARNVPVTARAIREAANPAPVVRLPPDPATSNGTVLDHINRAVALLDKMMRETGVGLDSRFRQALCEVHTAQKLLQANLPGFELDTGAHKTIATQEQCENFAEAIGLPRKDGEWFFFKMVGANWKNGGMPVANWQATMRAWKLSGYMASQKEPVNDSGFQNGHARARVLVADHDKGF